MLSSEEKEGRSFPNPFAFSPSQGIESRRNTEQVEIPILGRKCQYMLSEAAFRKTLLHFQGAAHTARASEVGLLDKYLFPFILLSLSVIPLVRPFKEDPRG